MARRPEAPSLSALESRVMDIVWRRREATADDVRHDLGGKLTNATVRTILRRIEAKGFLTHRLDRRAFIYAPQVQPDAVARGLLRRVIDRFYGGSAERLVLGLLDGRLIDRRKLDRLARRIRSAARRRRVGSR